MKRVVQTCTCDKCGQEVRYDEFREKVEVSFHMAEGAVLFSKRGHTWQFGDLCPRCFDYLLDAIAKVADDLEG